MNLGWFGGPAFRRLERLGPAEAGTPSSQRFMVPMRGIKVVMAVSMNLKIVDLQTNDLRKYGSWSRCARKKGCRLPMNLGWFGVPPLGGSTVSDRLKPGLQAVRGSWSQCAASKSW